VPRQHHASEASKRSDRRYCSIVEQFEERMAADPPTLTIARLARLLENHGPGDLSLPQYRVLGLLSSGHERAGDLAARLAVTKPTLTALVDGLAERGYVVRETPAGDRRAVRVSITDDGRDAAVRAGRAFREVLDEVLGYCADPATVLAALDGLREALDARWLARAAKAVAARP
jgi:DNA-binding MarR family transcriptional regulator